MADALPARIKARLEALNMAEREASRRSSFGLGYVGDIVSGRSKSPEMSKLLRLAETLECDVEYLIGTQDTPRRGGEVVSMRRTAAGDSLIDLYAAEGLPGGVWFTPTKKPAARVPPLPNLIHVPSAYAVSVPTDHMAPRYMVGEVVYANPALAARGGDFVVVRKKDGSVAIGQLESVDERITLAFLKTGARPTHLKREEIASIHRIVGSVSP